MNRPCREQKKTESHAVVLPVSALRPTRASTSGQLVIRERSSNHTPPKSNSKAPKEEGGIEDYEHFGVGRGDRLDRLLKKN